MNILMGGDCAHSEPHLVKAVMSGERRVMSNLIVAFGFSILDFELTLPLADGPQAEARDQEITGRGPPLLSPVACNRSPAFFSSLLRCHCF
jgi:hypothetical protein